MCFHRGSGMAIPVSLSGGTLERCGLPTITQMEGYIALMLAPRQIYIYLLEPSGTEDLGPHIFNTIVLFILNFYFNFF